MHTVILADLNGDGKRDIISSAYAGFIAVLLNQTLFSNVKFAAAVQYTDSFPVVSVLGDVNGDGKPDVVSASDQSSNVNILLGNGNGTFQSQTTTSAGAPTLGVALGDLNNDGKQDIVATRASATTIAVLLGNGNGTFRPQSAIPSVSALKVWRLMISIVTAKPMWW